MQSQILIYKTILLLYGAEAWPLTTKMQSKVQAAKTTVLGVINGVTRRNRCRNTGIREQMAVGYILEDIECSKRRWYGHVMRIGDDRLPKSS